MFCFYLAQELGMSVTEVMQFSVKEIRYWSAYFEILRRENERHKPNNIGNR